MYLLAFVLGIITQNFFSPAFLLFFLLSTDLKKTIISLLVFLLGGAWMYLHQGYQSPPILDGQHHYVGIIKSFIMGDKVQVQLLKLDDKAHEELIWLHLPATIKSIYPGEVWKFQGRHWHQQARSFWYQDAFRHLDGHCSSMGGGVQRLHGIKWWDVLSRLKQKYYLMAQARFTDDFSRSIFLTLVLGLGSELEAVDWDLFKVTGTAHLMVVSGAHLALLMGLVSSLVSLFCRLCPPLNIWLPRQQLSSVLALILGLIYALLTGFSIPVKRAWLMMAMRWVHYFIPMRISSWQAYRWSFGFLVMWEPHSLFYPATYLSYGAVGVLMYVAQIPIQKNLIKTVLSQTMCVVAMAPLTVLWFESIPVIGIVANFFAIPWVSFLLLPAGLLLTVCDRAELLQFFNVASNGLKYALNLVAKAQMFNFHLHWSTPIYCALMVLSGVLLFWLPTLPIMLMVGIWSGLLMYPHPLRLKFNDFWVQVLDVGQGLSVRVATKSHALLFDTATETMARFHLLPYLKQLGGPNYDMVVVSHHDADHAGGAKVIAQQFRPRQWVSSFGWGRNCQKMPAWHWDGVDFEFLKYQVKDNKKNNTSCVLKISNGSHSMLLTGDIERSAEYQLIYKHQKALQSSVLLVPHHGSLTSSSYWFLDMVKPQLAIASYALHNHYRLPHPDIVKRYEHFLIRWLSTAKEGSINIYFFGKRMLTESKSHHPWWQYFW